MSDIAVCPECDKPEIYFRSGKQGGPRGYRCYGCRATFDQPHHRPTRRNQNSGIPKGSLARKLLEMDPGEVSSD